MHKFIHLSSQNFPQNTEFYPQRVDDIMGPQFMYKKPSKSVKKCAELLKKRQKVRRIVKKSPPILFFPHSFLLPILF